MHRRSIVSGVLVVALIGGIGWLLWAWVPLPSCPADGLIIDVPEGWHLERDRANGCEWTLFDDAGGRAPRELYDGLSIDAPPSLLLNPVRLVPIGMIVVSVVGLFVTSPQRERHVRSAA